MILRPVSPASPIGPPMTKRPVGIDVELGVLVDHVRRDDGLDHFLHHEVFVQHRRCETLSLCCVEITTQSTRAGRPSTYSTVTCDLPSGRRKSTMPFLRTSASLCVKLVRQLDRQRHQLGASRRRQSRTSGPGRPRRRYRRPWRYPGDCLLDGGDHAAGFGVEAELGARVADVANHIAGEFRIIGT